MIQINNSSGPIAAHQKPPPTDVPDEKLNPVSMLDERWDRIAMNLIGNPQRYREKIIIPHSLGGGYITTNEEKDVKSFALFGTVFSAAKCTIEFYRGKTDWKNGTYAAALIGGMLGLRGNSQYFN
ncbi:unnamed protein product [Trichogramma brassicae]|uniref:Uncharacterized protein n=1 Tax=Trichogramma brassicae TaxID=86971 RepID=A0A6H5IKB1_9HYME|nr:unnamed protein product [Trichogramma brassicae]